MNGTSLAAILRSPAAIEARYEQYYEMEGHRGLYRDGYEVVTRHVARTRFDDAEWELYDLRVDPNELHDLAADQPERVVELAARFDDAAHGNDVYPLDEGTGWRYVIRPSKDDEFGDPVTICAGHPDPRPLALNRLLTQRNTMITISCSFGEGDRGHARRPRRPGRRLPRRTSTVGTFAFAFNDGHGRMSRLDGGR